MEQKTLRCDCIGGTHYIDIKYFKDEPQFCFELMDDTHQYGFLSRLKIAWNFLRGRNVFIDDIILKPKKAKELIKFLQKGLKDFKKESEIE